MAIDIKTSIQLDTAKDIEEYVEELLRPVSPDDLPAIRKRQLEFLDEFGEFDQNKFRRGLWVGASPDGRFVGFLFTGEDCAVRERVFVRTEMIPALVRMLSIAFDIAIERARTAGATAGSA